MAGLSLPERQMHRSNTEKSWIPVACPLGITGFPIPPACEGCGIGGDYTAAYVFRQNGRGFYRQLLQTVVFRSIPDVVTHAGQAAVPHVSHIRVWSEP